MIESVMTKIPNDENTKHKKCVTPKRTCKSYYNMIVTPPKQKCYNHNHSEDTETENKIELSPNTLLSQLDLDSPKNVGNKPVKNLFNNDKFQNARIALHSLVPENMPGREEELGKIESFVRDKIEKKVSGTLYISGSPGTGKTAALSIILNKLKVNIKFGCIHWIYYILDKKKLYSVFCFYYFHCNLYIIKNCNNIYV